MSLRQASEVVFICETSPLALATIATAKQPVATLNYRDTNGSLDVVGLPYKLKLTGKPVHSINYCVSSLSSLNNMASNKTLTCRRRRYLSFLYYEGKVATAFTVHIDLVGTAKYIQKEQLQPILDNIKKGYNEIQKAKKRKVGPRYITLVNSLGSARWEICRYNRLTYEKFDNWVAEEQKKDKLKILSKGKGTNVSNSTQPSTGINSTDTTASAIAATVCTTSVDEFGNRTS